MLQANVLLPYLRAGQSGKIGSQIILYSLGSTGQCRSSNHQNKENDVWKKCCKPHYLKQVWLLLL